MHPNAADHRHIHGRPGGIGPEICAKALALKEIYAICRPIVVGDAGVMADAVRFCGLKLERRPAAAGLARPASPCGDDRRVRPEEPAAGSSCGTSR
ncbi:MAG: hypothetical protein MZV70_28785 [Desulfobacterales bacterium]|nr:hypothetical protein [Desulfobacterales bacterium]